MAGGPRYDRVGSNSRSRPAGRCDVGGLVAADVVGGRIPPPDLPPGPWRDLVDIIRRLRRARTLSGRQVAQRSGLSSSYVSEIFNRRKAPSPDAAEQLVRALGADDELALKARRLAEEQAELDEHQRRVAREGQPPTATGIAPRRKDGQCSDSMSTTGSISQSGNGTNVANSGVIGGDFSVGGSLS